MSALIFVDTNVLLYTVDVADSAKHKRARAWHEFVWRTRQGRVSFQVLQEFYVNVCKKWPTGKVAARQEIKDLLAWSPMKTDGDLLQVAWKL